MALNLVCAVLDRGPSDLAEMAVLLAIADSADKDSGEAWPSQSTIARRARQTDRSVRNVLRRLVDGGWLSIEPRKRPNGSATSNLYTVNLDKLGERLEASTARNHVPGGSGTTFRAGSEPRSTHAPEPCSAPEPSHKKEPSRQGRQAAAPRAPASRAPVARPMGGGSGLASGLSQFQLARLLSGQSILIDGKPCLPGSATFESLRQAARAQDAMKRGAA